ncbi:efflux RND transporter permease subunit [Chelatococcus reniformis]|uniref:Multidrug transporter n=1 Tax=Chelatococcus reniformis TaxID=1494448 RepID=A0A916UNA9_9HYPH|nr:efflux RND transporter permease subunit [Chelatococcus reniformis]GGC78836.1 multidrug transporter [Chelatococcus reniformis]
MNVSEFCIRHPVATILMSAALVIGGLFAYRFLPVAALPNTDFPVISVTAQLPGASPDTMANSIATPLIKQFATIPAIDSMSASSTQGNTVINIQFALSRNIDAAAADVQSAITRTQRQLPIEMTTPPSFRKANPADAPVLLLTLTSDVLPLSTLDAFAQQVISPAVSTIDGVAQLLIYGSQKFAVRVQADPNALAVRGIGVDQLQNAVAQANSSTPVGTLQNPSQNLTIQADTQMEKAAQFRDVIVAYSNGRPVRLRDVANVIDSVENNQTASWHDGSRAIILAVQRQPDANTVDVVDKVKAMLPAFQAQLPPSAKIQTLIDRSTSIRHAVEDVQLTLLLTIGLVILVIFLFLRRLSATIIPSLAVPISIIATLGAMYLLGFSIDNISLLGLTLSVGLVVDDAIVMVENIYRHMEEEGKSAFQAALDGSREIGFTIVSITVSLVAVFIPVLLMGGVVGRVFHEFAVVVTCALAASAFVSLTLTPMLASRMLPRPLSHEEARRGIGGLLERGFDRMLGAYDFVLKAALRFKIITFMVFLATIGATAYLFVVIPKGFFPIEDIDQLSISTEARQDISFAEMAKLQGEVEATFRRSPYVKHAASIIGATNSTVNQGRGFVELKPKAERPELKVVLAELRRDLARIPGIQTYMIPNQNLRFGTTRTKSQYQLVLQGLEQSTLYDWAVKMTDAMRADPAFVDVSSDLQANALQSTVAVDRDKATALGISADQIRSTLYSGFGVRQISTIYNTGDSYRVIIEFDPRYGWSNNLLDTVRIRSANGTLVPISAFARIERTSGTLSVNQLGQLPAVTLSFNLPPGKSLSDATAAVDALKGKLGMPPSITTVYSGDADIYQQSLANQGILLLAAIITIYIVLGILYESFVHPFTILTGLPAAALGALATLQLFGLDLSVIAIIGILMLIGIVKKNAIMMIDVALQLLREGAEPESAIYRACILRFRPIMMTTFAALVGTIPIAVGAGASSELRQPLGVAVVGGLVVSQLLTLFITPVLFLYMDRLSKWLAGLGRRKARVDAPAAAPVLTPQVNPAE